MILSAGINYFFDIQKDELFYNELKIRVNYL